MRGARRVFPGDRGGEVVALEGIDLEIEEGSFVALLGPSGCGKSTLLRLISGLDRADGGEVDVPHARARRLGVVFQDAHLLPWRTVEENVALPLELLSTPRSERDGAVRACLRDVGLLDAARRYPSALSGGMRMRASIARALVTRPRMLLMDEPFAALDELTRHRLDEQLRALWQAQKLTVVFVTHTIFEATFLAERALVLSARPGRIAYDAKIELPTDRPASLRADASFVREAARLLSALEEASA